MRNKLVDSIIIKIRLAHICCILSPLIHYAPRVNEPWIYIEPTLAVHIGQMLNTNVGPSMKYETVCPILDTTVESILWGNLQCWIAAFAQFRSSICSGQFQRWINIVWQHINIALQSWNNIDLTLHKYVDNSLLYLFTFLIYFQCYM